MATPADPGAEPSTVVRARRKLVYTMLSGQLLCNFSIRYMLAPLTSVFIAAEYGYSEAQKAALLKDVNKSLKKNAQNKKDTEFFASATSFWEGKSDAKKQAQAYMDANWIDWDGEE